VEGFDACTRHVADCLQSHNSTVSPQLSTDLLNHLAACRRRLQHVAVLPSVECVRLCSDSQNENTNCPRTTSVMRQIRTIAGEKNRKPLVPIDNAQSVSTSAAETGVKTQPPLHCEHSSDGEHRYSKEPVMSQSLADSDIHRRPSDHTSHEADDDAMALMWRPW